MVEGHTPYVSALKITDFSQRYFPCALWLNWTLVHELRSVCYLRFVALDKLLSFLQSNRMMSEESYDALLFPAFVSKSKLYLIQEYLKAPSWSYNFFRLLASRLRRASALCLDASKVRAKVREET